MHWTLKTIFYCHVPTFAYNPPINNKIENIFSRSKLAIINIWENPNSIMVLTKKYRKLDQSVPSPFCMFWIPYFPIYLPNELLKFKKFLSKKSRLKQSWFAILKKRSRYKVLNFEVDFLKTEVFQIEQNGSQATKCIFSFLSS